ncbi:nuclease-related domain-containing protein [Streptomonospora alba]|nr:nuclease-related domain-containing protein [Streptomonospora alba]
MTDRPRECDLLLVAPHGVFLLELKADAEELLLPRGFGAPEYTAA